MNRKVIIAIVIGLVIGVAGTLGVTAMTSKNDNSTKNVAADHSTMSMADMTKELQTKSGDDYDKAFIEMMIAHHQGAIDMAELSEDRAKHSEIKELSKEITKAQTDEISEMYQWQAAWGYTSNNNSMPGMHH